MEYNIFDIYDLAEQGERTIEHNFMFLAVPLTIIIHKKNKVSILFQTNTDIEKEFDIRNYNNPVEFEEAIDNWVTKNK